MPPPDNPGPAGRTEAAQGARAAAAAIGLALAAAVSLGLARFSYALLLPPMRDELGWSYLTAGAMNTANAAGYLAGALLMPAALRRWDARALMLAGSVGAALLLLAHGAVRHDALLYALRGLTGIASAASFVAGGLLAARLASSLPAGSRVTPGLVLGLYYGGTGLGIVGSSLIVPALPWPGAWMALGAAAALATAIAAIATRDLRAPPVRGASRAPAPLAPMAWMLGGYLMFGLGYIGYMTFVITLLREQGLAPAVVIAFYVVLGSGVVASSWLWSGLLQRWRGGQTLALLNGLLAVATALLVASAHPVAVFASGALFGSVFLSVVASTTAFVRHNLPGAQWPSGITAFTIVFAGGQIVGPSLVGWVADGPGGLVRGLGVSATLLGLGAWMASRQRAGA